MLVIFSTYITVHCPYNVNVQRWLHDSFFTAFSCRIAVADPLAPICRPVGLQCRPAGPHMPPRGIAVAAPWGRICRLWQTHGKALED